MSCPTCGHAPANPYRCTDPKTGRVLNGCVDQFHTGHLVPGSESARWHARPEAKALRQKAARWAAKLAKEARAAKAVARRFGYVEA